MFVFLASPGVKRVVIFVDDLSIPKKEKYGAQSVIELLRQYQVNFCWVQIEKQY